MSTELQQVNYQISKPETMISLANELKKFIIEQKLFSNIQGKEFANVEAWQYAGLCLGIIPIVESTRNLSTPDEYKYECIVSLYNTHTDKMVGKGIALCSNKEKTKKYFDEYAILSMSQTRAVGKAYRLMLGWLMKAAGYEPTPAEEMDEVKGPSKPVEVKPVYPMASEDQKKAILSLCRHQFIYEKERSKIEQNINTYDTQKAVIIISTLENYILERTPKQEAVEDETGEIATTKQTELLWRLLQSSVVTPAERGIVQSNLQTMTKKRASELIEHWTQELKVRKQNAA